MDNPEIRNFHELAGDLVSLIESLCPVVVAFSGGVDSSVVAAAAFRASPTTAKAVTADSPSVPREQLEIAKRVAREIGISHRIVHTEEMTIPEYRRNDGQRCFHCKQTLYNALTLIANEYGNATVLSGTNADDLDDYRPGIQAGKLAGVRAPLAELHLNKAAVRELARWWNLSVSESPASPCLSSRVAYGIEVTPERLARIEQAERLLRGYGFHDTRVRLHADELARIEIAIRDWPRLHQDEVLEPIVNQLRALGFRYVTLDLQGRQSGSLNRSLVQITS